MRTKGFHYRALRGISWRGRLLRLLRLINLERLIDRLCRNFLQDSGQRQLQFAKIGDDTSRNRQANRSFSNGFMISVIGENVFGRFARTHTRDYLLHIRAYNAVNMSENLFPERNVNTYRRANVYSTPGDAKSVSFK